MSAEPHAAVTVLIPAKDEALHIARCVDSAQELGRVVVLDGGSTDATAAIARAHGADVVEHTWTGYAAQKNWALESLELETPWVLFLDADEFITPSGRAEIAHALRSHGPAGFLLPRNHIFLGRELKHAFWYPDLQLRLFRHGHGRFEERRVHEHLIVNGPVAELSSPLMHENLKGFSAYVDRHNRYSDLEAAELLDPTAGRKRGSFRGGWADRRRALKDRVWFRLPFRPAVRFFWLYVLRRGFLDGRPGLAYCQLLAVYEYMINTKVLEQRLAAREGLSRLSQERAPADEPS